MRAKITTKLKLIITIAIMLTTSNLEAKAAENNICSIDTFINICSDYVDVEQTVDVGNTYLINIEEFLNSFVLDNNKFKITDKNNIYSRKAYYKKGTKEYKDLHSMIIDNNILVYTTRFVGLDDKIDTYNGGRLTTEIKLPFIIKETNAVTSGDSTVYIENDTCNNIVYVISDKTKAVKDLSITGIKNNKFYKGSVNITATTKSDKILYYTLDSDYSTETKIIKNNKFNIKLSREGDYTLTVRTINEEKVINFSIDNTKPYVEGIENNGCYNKMVVFSYKDDMSGVKTVKFNEDITTDEYAVFGEGKYTIKLTDKVGNTATYIFCIDYTEPIIKGVKNKKTYKGKVKITVSDELSPIKEVKVNNKKVKYSNSLTFSKKGTYVISVKDKAGNEKKVKFYIK